MTTIGLQELQLRLDEDLVNDLLYDHGQAWGFVDVDELITDLGLDLGAEDELWSRVEQWMRERVNLALLLGARIAAALLAGQPDLKTGDYNLAMIEVARAYAQQRAEAAAWQATHAIADAAAAGLWRPGEVDALLAAGTAVEVAEEARRRLVVAGG